MRKRKMALQLYTLRNEGQKMGMDYVLKAVSDMGYMGVEPAGFYDMTPEQFVEACQKYNLEIVSAHMPLDLKCAKATIKTAKMMGLKHLICGYGKDAFKDLKAIKATAKLTSQLCDICEDNGMKLVQHNHAHEFEMLNGKLKYDIYSELCPKVFFQMDIYWATNFFTNCEIEMMERFHDRIALLHLKDGVGTGTIHMRPLGEGKLDIAGICEVCPDSIDNIIVELDATPINQLLAVQYSYDFMTGNDLAIGYK